MGSCCVAGATTTDEVVGAVSVAEVTPAAIAKTAQNPDATVIDFLSKVALFKRLPADQHPILASAMQKVTFGGGESLMKQGDSGDEFFVIVSGTVAVIIDGNKVATLKSGDYLGENALLRNDPRNATITADGATDTLKLTRDKFQELGLIDKLEFPKRQAVPGGNSKDIVIKPPSVKTPEDVKTMTDAMKSNKNLATMVTLDDAKCKALIDLAWEETIPPGENVITQGSDQADYFYVIKSGTFEIMLKKEAAQSADKAAASVGESVGTVSKGQSFGELALLYFAPRAATVRANNTAVVWVIDRKNFKAVLAASSENMAATYVKYLDSNELFRNLKPDEKLEVAKNFQEKTFSKDETVFEQGQPGSEFYILTSGEVSVIKDAKEIAKIKGTPDNATIFGELALMGDAARGVTVKVTSETISTLFMDKKSFELLLGPFEAIKKRGADAGESQVGKVPDPVAAPAIGSDGRVQEKIFRKDLKKLGLLGCGGFGAVELVEHTKSQDTFALKALSKGYVVKCGMTKGVMSEKNIQWMCDSPFVVKLYACYNSDQSLFFLLELALGGELYATYAKKAFHGSDKHAKFYIAGTVFGFVHMHDKKIIFRDLKPENLLLTEGGFIKLTDMGLAKVVVGKTYTTCGTPDYFAPELIASAGHTNAVDWWCLGVLTFELMTGHPPFESAAPMQIYSKVTKGINKVTFPAKIKGTCEDLVKALCKKEPTDRLAMKKGGIQNVKAHKWFDGFDWDKMQVDKLEPPYKPKVKSAKDASNFSANKADMPPQIKYKDDGSGWDKDFATSE